MLQRHNEARDARKALETAHFMALRDANPALTTTKRDLNEGSRLIGTIVTLLFHHVPAVMTSNVYREAADETLLAADFIAIPPLEPDWMSLPNGPA